MTTAEEELLRYLQHRPDITEHIVKRLREACETRPGGHVLIDLRCYNQEVQDAEVTARLKVGVR